MLTDFKDTSPTSPSGSDGLDDAERQKMRRANQNFSISTFLEMCRLPWNSTDFFSEKKVI